MIEFMGKMTAFLTRSGGDVVATIDPGMNTGIAIWDADYMIKKHKPHTHYFTVPSGINGKVEKLTTAWLNFEYFLQTNKNIDVAYIEDTALWQESLTSLTSGATGDLIMLSQLVGGYVLKCTDFGITPRLIPAQQWKGQLTKEAVARRIEREVGWTYPNSHITDAVGMGISLINEWRVTK